MSGDREHIAELSQHETRKLSRWLARPNGAFITTRVTFEAVEGGGILVRTQPYGVSNDSTAAASAL